ncbi:unnamed protein product [Pleuronectes platessa]|uniref:Uncharacterized protein n=1 Tax=Pleuronectes platessa TaxID=8262 RepID=A0A9N7UPN6_PLEPL|nr:unnamed protein product [Pleuronectes platessa]
MCTAVLAQTSVGAASSPHPSVLAAQSITSTLQRARNLPNTSPEQRLLFGKTRFIHEQMPYNAQPHAADTKHKHAVVASRWSVGFIVSTEPPSPSGPSPVGPHHWALTSPHFRPRRSRATGAPGETGGASSGPPVLFHAGGNNERVSVRRRNTSEAAALEQRPIPEPPESAGSHKDSARSGKRQRGPASFFFDNNRCWDAEPLARGLEPRRFHKPLLSLLPLLLSSAAQMLRVMSCTP